MPAPKLHTFGNETLNTSQWADRLGIHISNFIKRLNSDMSMKEIFSPTKNRSKFSEDDLPGLVFNSLIIMGECDSDTHGRSVATLCNLCGRATKKKLNDVVSGFVKSCGCQQHPTKYAYDSFVGKKFGLLTCLKENDKIKASGGKLIRNFSCKCECGRTTTVHAYSLVSNMTGSCGNGECRKNLINTRRAELIREHGSSDFTVGLTIRGLKILEEKRYVYKPSGRSEKGYILLCHCGKKFHAPRQRLLDPTVKGCGCSSKIKRYKGKTIAEWAKELNITHTLIQSRIKRGWSFAEAIRPPFGKISTSIHAIGAKIIDNNGYVSLKVPKNTPGARGSGWVLEHRYVMQKRLKRPLKKYEDVHHINGIKDDNRRSNLELWTTQQQPSGQRVKDRIKYYKKFLKEYGYEVFWNKSKRTSKK